MWKWFKWIGVVILPVRAMAQVANPTFDYAAGSYLNSLSVTPTTATAGASVCCTKDGSTPGAGTPGTCDASPTFLAGTTVPAYLGAASLPASVTLKCLGTKVGLANSGVVSLAVQLTHSSMNQTILNTTPVKVTNASGTQVYGLPFLIKVSATKFLLFATLGAAAVDASDPPQQIVWWSSSDGVNWTPGAKRADCGAGDASNCFYHNGTKADWPLGGGADCNSSAVVLFISENEGDGTYTNDGTLPMRSTDGGVTWTNGGFINATGHTVTEWSDPTSYMGCIPSGSPGVSGSCSTGCLFQEVTNGCPWIFWSFDGGATWPAGSANRVNGPTSLCIQSPAVTEEMALIWTSGNNMMLLARPGAQGPAPNGPNAAIFASSTNLGTTWSVTGGGGLGTNASNFNLLSCAGTFTTTLTRPTWVTDPQDSTQVSVLFGEREACTGVSVFDFRIATFNPATLITNSGQSTPLWQQLHLYPANVENGSVAQPHTTYSSMVALNANQLLVAFEQGSGTHEDIMTTILGYSDSALAGATISGGTRVH